MIRRDFPHRHDFDPAEEGYNPCVVSSQLPEHIRYSLLYEAIIRREWWQIQKGDIVFDVGAAFGSYTLSALAKGADYVIGFEPGRLEYFDIYTQLFVNNFLSRAVILPVLVGESFGEGDYYPESSSQRPEGFRERRICVSLDGVINHCNTARLDWIKIDVEGVEMEVLRGARRCLERFHPNLLIENHVGFYPGIDQEARDFLIPLGYEEEQWIGNEEKGSNENWSKWTFVGKGKEDSYIL